MSLTDRVPRATASPALSCHRHGAPRSGLVYDLAENAGIVNFNYDIIQNVVWA